MRRQKSHFSVDWVKLSIFSTRAVPPCCSWIQGRGFSSGSSSVLRPEEGLAACCAGGRGQQAPRDCSCRPAPWEVAPFWREQRPQRPLWLHAGHTPSDTAPPPHVPSLGLAGWRWWSRDAGAPPLHRCAGLSQAHLNLHLSLCLLVAAQICVSLPGANDAWKISAR